MELVVTPEEEFHRVEAEEAALVQAIAEGLETERVSKQCVLDILRKKLDTSQVTTSPP